MDVYVVQAGFCIQEGDVCVVVMWMSYKERRVFKTIYEFRKVYTIRKKARFFVTYPRRRVLRRRTIQKENNNN